MLRSLALTVSAVLSATALLAQPPPPTVVGDVLHYTVVTGDTLTAIGARAGVSAGTIAIQNGRPLRATIRPGDTLVIDARHIAPPAVPGGLVINAPQRMLFFFAADGDVIAVPVALGRPTWQTPTGTFTVLTRETNPTWDVPISIQEEMRRAGKEPVTRVPPSPENPLGDYWLGTSLSGIGIHSTNAPSSIYSFTTHGCVRVHPDRIKALFDAVAVGTPGAIVYQPVLMTEHEGRVFVEIHPDIYGRQRDAPIDELRRAAQRLGLDSRIDWPEAEAAARLRLGVAVDVTASSTSGRVQP